MSKIIGIDLGTTFSAVSVIEGGQATIISNSEGKRTTPSVVAFTKEGERKIGDPAKRQAITNPKNTVYAIKRFMGMPYSQSDKEIKRVSYEVKKGDNDTPVVKIDDKNYTPQEISAMILQKMKATAEEYLGEEVKEAVVTVPAYFNDTQRSATKEAGAIAGLDIKRIINEPTAAALAYGIDKNGKDEKIVVFDCGGGTHDVSILEFGNGVFEVLGTAGDTHLGGEDFDQKIIEWLASEFKSDEGIDLMKDPMALQRLKEAAEKAKIELSSQSSSEINLPYITAVDGVPKHLVKSLTRAKFEQLCDDLFNRTIAPCNEALEAAGLTPSDIDEILLVGGSTRIPRIQELVKEKFGNEPNKGINPDEAVAMGAAIQGGVLAGDVQDVILLDVTPLNLGIETMGGVMTSIIDANTTIPIKKTQTFSTAEDNQPAVTIRVLQGNRPMANDNKQLGIFNLDGLAPAPRGTVKVDVTFEIDANGIMNVTAVDAATKKEQHITIEAGTGLSEDEIKRMKEEAEKFAEEDKKKKEEIDKINMADATAFQMEKTVNEMSDKLTDEEKKTVGEKIEALKKAVSDKNVEEIDKCQKDLQDFWTPIITKIYQENASADAQSAQGTEDKSSTEGPEEAQTV